MSTLARTGGLRGYEHYARDPFIDPELIKDKLCSDSRGIFRSIAGQSPIVARDRVDDNTRLIQAFRVDRVVGFSDG